MDADQIRRLRPELTVRQVHTAVGSLVCSWWLCGRASTALIEQTATVI